MAGELQDECEKVKQRIRYAVRLHEKKEATSMTCKNIEDGTQEKNTFKNKLNICEMGAHDSQGARGNVCVKCFSRGSKHEEHLRIKKTNNMENAERA